MIRTKRIRYSNIMENSLEEIAMYRVRQIKRFYTHLGIYTIGVVIFIMKEYFNTSFNFPLVDYINWFSMSCWTFIIAVKGIKLFVKEVVLDKQWENRKINEILESEANNQK